MRLPLRPTQFAIEQSAQNCTSFAQKAECNGTIYASGPQNCYAEMMGIHANS